MASRAQARRRQRARARARRLDPVPGSNRSQLVALVVLIISVLAIAFVVTAFGSSGADPREARSQTGVPTGRPEPTVIATVRALPIKLPIAQRAITAIGFHSAPNAVSLEPEGSQANEGLLGRFFHRVSGGGSGALRYYLISGGTGTDKGALDVGAPAGADVYSPINGTIIGISDFVLNGRPYGVRIDIRPADVPSLIVSITRLERDPTLAVGKPVVEGSSRLGRLLDLSKVEKQALARYTQDEGNHVTVEVRESATVAG